MSTTKHELQKCLYSLARQYENLSDERNFLLNGVAARLAIVEADRAEVVAEAQVQLDRYNALRVADGEPALTLQQVRNHLTRTGPRAGA